MSSGRNKRKKKWKYKFPKFKRKKDKTKNTTPEIKFEKLLRSSQISYKKQFTLPYNRHRTDCKKHYDFFLPNFELLVEIDGIYWHGKGKDYKEMDEIQKSNYENDKFKTKVAAMHGMKLIRIWEDQVSNIHLNRLLKEVNNSDREFGLLDELMNEHLKS